MLFSILLIIIFILLCLIYIKKKEYFNKITKNDLEKIKLKIINYDKIIQNKIKQIENNIFKPVINL